MALPARHSLPFLLLAAWTAFAQAPPPVIDPRGVLNDLTLQPAPSTVAPGALLRIRGYNLAPPAPAKAESLPWPAQLGDPAVEVLIANRPAPLYSVAPETIVCQVPLETPSGVVPVVVRRGEQSSRPVRFTVAAVHPSLRTANGSGFGAAATQGDARLTLSAAGLGATEPRQEDGAAGPANPPAAPRQPVLLFLDGLPAGVQASLSTSRVGEFDVSFDLPAAARAGDILRLVAAGRAANPVTYGKAAGPQLLSAAIPEGAPELRAAQISDLRSSYAVFSGPRTDEGCHPSYVFDLARGTAAAVDGCLAAANASAPTPVLALAESPYLASFLGPIPDTEGGVSKRIALFNPLLEQPVVAELPEEANNITATAAGEIVAIVAGPPRKFYRIDPQTGAVEEADAPGGASPGAGGGGSGFNLANFTIDLGDGLTHVVSAPVAGPQSAIAIVVGDDAAAPKKAKLAFVNLQGQVTATKEFPDGLLPMAAPPARAGTPGRPGQPARAFPVAVHFDGQTRRLYVPSRDQSRTKDAFSIFAFDDSETRAAVLPDGYFFTSCTPVTTIFNLELSRSIALFASRRPDDQVRAACPAAGFLIVDLNAQSVTAKPLPGSGQLNAAAATGDINDFVFAVNLDSTQQNVTDTLYLLDGVSAATQRLDLPAGMVAFAGLQPVPALNFIIAAGRGRTAADGGLVVFDLERSETRTLAIPAGFESVNLIAVFPATRKLVARGNREGGAGSQFLIYHLDDGDLDIIANPAGVDFVGGIPATPPQAGQPAVPGTVNILRPNVKANAIIALGYDAARKQTRVLALRVH